MVAPAIDATYLEKRYNAFASLGDHWMADTTTSGSEVLSAIESAAVERQMELLLESPHFSHSKRFPSFLRFVVGQTLAGEADSLKERTLGIEVFGKDADYDTASDPIVRVTAAEIRKRIAQYYQDPGHQDELRITLPSGGYIPQFHWPHIPEEAPQSAKMAQAGLVPAEPLFPAEASQGAAIPSSSTRYLTFAAGLALGLAIAFAGWFYLKPRPTALDRFWAPVLRSGEPVAVCYPLNHFDSIMLRYAADPSQEKLAKEETSALVVDDLQPLTSITGLLTVHHQGYLLMGDSDTTLTDLRRGPAIFVGAFDNAWTLRMTRGLRYRFGNDADMTHFWIEDTQSPTHVTWSIDRGQQQATHNYRDYAIVARFQDANTGKLAVVLAGIARGGTVAAGEFLTIPANMELIKARAPKNWDGQNMEFVLSTEIIDGRSSPPRIEAAYFW
jgi:hypothetical protein